VNETRILRLLLVMGLGTACTPTRGFQCGEPLASDHSVIRSCTRPHELCVCATNSCAAPAAACPSGFQYVDQPFAAPEVAGQCVPEIRADTVVPPGMTTQCPAAVCISNCDGGADTQQSDAGSEQ
jgi:hypothetical protein